VYKHENQSPITPNQLLETYDLSRKGQRSRSQNYQML